MDIIDVSYEELEKRIQSAKNDKKLKQKAREWAAQYLSLPGTRLETKREFVDNCFLLYYIFKDLMQEHGTNAFTIKSCMGTIMPMADTTACLTLGFFERRRLYRLL